MEPCLQLAGGEWHFGSGQEKLSGYMADQCHAMQLWLWVRRSRSWRAEGVEGRPAAVGGELVVVVCGELAFPHELPDKAISWAGAAEVFSA